MLEGEATGIVKGKYDVLPKTDFPISVSDVRRMVRWEDGVKEGCSLYAVSYISGWHVIIPHREKKYCSYTIWHDLPSTMYG